MKRFRKFLKKFDVFGVPFLFLYKNKNKYSTSFGGLTFIIYCIAVLIVIIYYFVPLFQRKNYSMAYYSKSIAETETIELKESNLTIALGFDCPFDKKMGLNAKDLFDIKLNYIKYTKDKEGNKHKEIKTLSTHSCNYSDFYNISIHSLDLINIDKFQCLDETNEIIKGIWNDELFSYYEFSVLSKNDSANNYKNIDEYLITNDCKFELYYTDISVNLDEFNEPINPYINSIFLQLDPTLYMKMNVFFMNQHFLDNKNFIYDFNKGDTIIRALFSRADKYFLYKGLNRGVEQPYDYQNYAKIYIRADTKRLDIKRKYQNIMEYYADLFSILLGIFRILSFIFSFINGFYANISISKILFYFKETEDNDLDIIKKYKHIQKLIGLTEPFLIRLSSNNLNFKDINRKDDKKNHSFDLLKKETEELNYIRNEEKPIYTKNNKKKEHKKNENFLHEKEKSTDFLGKEKNNSNTQSLRNIQNSNDRFQHIFPNLNIDKFEELSKKKAIPKIKYSFNLFEIVIGEFFKCCMTKKMKLKKNLNLSANNILNNKFDVTSYIKNMALLDIMNQTLLDRNTNNIFRFLSTPIISVNKKVSMNNYKICESYSEVDFDKLYNEISKLIQKTKKINYSKKLLSLSYQQLKEML